MRFVNSDWTFVAWLADKLWHFHPSTADKHTLSHTVWLSNCNLVAENRLQFHTKCCMHNVATAATKGSGMDNKLSEERRDAVRLDYGNICCQTESRQPMPQAVTKVLVTACICVCVCACVCD